MKRISEVTFSGIAILVDTSINIFGTDQYFSFQRMIYFCRRNEIYSLFYLPLFSISANNPKIEINIQTKNAEKYTFDRYTLIFITV